MMVQIDLRRRLQDTRCQDADDICAHFDMLLRMREELSGMGTTLADTDFSAITLSSLPNTYDTVLSLMLSAARISGKILDPLTIIAHIEPKPIIATDKHVFYATGRGDVIVNFPNDRSTSRVKLTDVLYTPTIAFMLISISQIDHSGFSTIFRDGSCQLRSPAGELIARIPRVDNLYKFECPADARAALALISVAPPESALLTLPAADLHRRLGHMSLDAAKRLICHGAIVGIDSTNLRLRQRPAQPAYKRRSPGKKYAMTMLDDASYEVLITFLKAKSEALEKYKNYCKFIEVQREAKAVKTFRSDRGGEYTSAAFAEYLASQGTHHELTVHDSSAQNGTAERFFRTSITRTLAMLIAAGLPKFLWSLAMQHAVWLWNRTGGQVTGDTTPHEHVTGEKPDLSSLHEWGCKVWVRMENQRKLDLRADEGRFVGYTTDSKGIIVYWPKRRMTTVERNVVWDDSVLPPITDEPPEAWLVDLFSGTSNEEWVVLDGDDAVPSDSSTPAANASDSDPPTA
ncbi:hypothetical protein EWM64_g6694, partial [Hericium alpestre]